RGQLLGQRRAGRIARRAYVREQLFEQAERVDPLEPEWPLVEIDEDHVRLAARPEALGKGEADPPLEPGRVERASRRRPHGPGGRIQPAIGRPKSAHPPTRTGSGPKPTSAFGVAIVSGTTGGTRAAPRRSARIPMGNSAAMSKSCWTISKRATPVRSSPNSRL